MCSCDLCRRRAALHGAGCRCPSCRGGLMGFEAAPAFRPCETDTRQRLVSELPAWSGWCHSTSLVDLIAAQPSPAGAEFRRSNDAWRRSNQTPIYRFRAGPAAWRQQGQRGRTRYVGLTFAQRGSVRDRVMRHLQDSSNDAASRGLRAFITRVGGQRNVMVEMGTAETRSPRLAHAVEILVQRAEKVLEWRRINRTTPFDEFESAVAGTLADLRRRA